MHMGEAQLSVGVPAKGIRLHGNIVWYMWLSLSSSCCEGVL